MRRWCGVAGLNVAGVAMTDVAAASRSHRGKWSLASDYTTRLLAVSRPALYIAPSLEQRLKAVILVMFE